MNMVQAEFGEAFLAESVAGARGWKLLFGTRYRERRCVILSSACAPLASVQSACVMYRSISHPLLAQTHLCTHVIDAGCVTKGGHPTYSSTMVEAHTCPSDRSRPGPHSSVCGS